MTSPGSTVEESQLHFVVIKVGSDVIASSHLADAAANIAALAGAGTAVVVVHDGTAQRDALRAALAQSQEAGGRGSASAAGALPPHAAGPKPRDVATMSIAGQASVDICAALLAAGADPVGLHGASAFAIRASLRGLPAERATAANTARSRSTSATATASTTTTGVKGAGRHDHRHAARHDGHPAEHGRPARDGDTTHEHDAAAHRTAYADRGDHEIGDVVGVNKDLLTLLTGMHYVPVIAALGADEHGHIIGVDVDTVASHLAVVLYARALVHVCADSATVGKGPGGLHTLSSARKLLEAPGHSPAFAAGIEVALAGLRAGVPSVHLVGPLEAGQLAEELDAPGSVGIAFKSDAVE